MFFGIHIYPKNLYERLRRAILGVFEDCGFKPIVYRFLNIIVSQKIHFATDNQKELIYTYRASRSLFILFF